MTDLAVIAVVAVAAALATIALTARHDIVTDEAWMLVVAERLQLRSDVLYRDVFFGVAPLPMWLLLATTRRTGIEVAALRRLHAACVGVLTAALWTAGRALDVPWWCALALAAVTVFGCGPVADVLGWYDNLTRAGVAVALCLVLDGRPWAVVGAGLAVGVAAMSKYTVAVITTPALLGLAWVTAHSRWWLVGGAVAALLVAAGSVAPLVGHPGAVRAMVLRLGPEKRSFVQHGRISLWRLVRGRQQAVRVMALSVPMAVVALPVTLWMWRDGAPPEVVWAVAVAVLAFVACTWPRADSAHLRSGLPFATFAVLAAAEAVDSAHPSIGTDVLRIAMAVWAVWLTRVGIIYSVRRGAFRDRSGRSVRGCRGAGCRYDDTMLHDLWVASELAGGVALVLGVDAPLASLVSGVHNPTAYDYPLASAFGVHGQGDVAARISDGRVHSVIEVDPMPTVMAPHVVDHAVAAHTEVVWQSGAVRLRARQR